MTVDEDGENDLELMAGLARLEQLANDRRTPEVLALATDLAAQYPRAFEPYYQRAQARWSGGDGAGALQDLSEAIERNPAEPALFYFRGLWALESGSRQAGIEALGEAIEKDQALGSSYYVDGARFIRAVGYVLESDFTRAELELGALDRDMTSFVVGKLWTSAKLREHIKARRR